MSACKLSGSNDTEPLIRLKDVKNAIIQGIYPNGKIKNFINVSGKTSKGIILKDNYLMKAVKTFELSGKVPDNAIKEINTIR
jgi:hypothetical protein